MHGMTFTERASRLAGLSALLLGWRPDEFWRATPVELAGIWDAARGEDAAEMPDSATIARLMERFPDG